MKLNMFAAACLAAFAVQALAQDKYPSRPVQVMVPVTVGTTADIVARMYTDRLPQKLGQPFIVQNRQGAGGVIATQLVAKSAADGYTLMLANSQHSVNPGLQENLPYDTLRDFAGIALVGEAPALVVVNPKLGVRTLKEFIDLAKAKPGTINYASAGIGSATHMSGAYFAGRAGVNMVHVPYKSSSDVVADMLSGRVESVFPPTAFLLSQIRDGRLLALGVSTLEPMRSPLEVPAIASQIPGFEYATWYGFIAPAKTPAPVMEQLVRAIREIAEDKEVKDKYAAQGINLRVLALREFDTYIKADIDKLAPMIKQVGARAN